MKLGVFTPVLYGQPLDKALEYLHSRGFRWRKSAWGATRAISTVSLEN